MDGFCVTGINHKYAPLEIREVLAFPDAAVPAALRALREQHEVAHAVILSTCNRVEILTYAPHADTPLRIRDFLSAHHHLSPDFFAEYLYCHRGMDAVRHVLRVAASLDSLVVGETQILHQMKQAWQISHAEDAAGRILTGLMQTAFTAAKRVHSATSISKGQISVASVAVSFIRRIFDAIEHKTVLLIGAGETGQLALRHLHDAGVGRVIVANRTLERARDLANVYGGDAIPLELLNDYLPRADIVVSQTSATEVIVGSEQVRAAMRARGHAPMLLIDLAVPRDIHASVAELDGVYLYDIDDLEQAAANAGESRLKEIERADRILVEAQARFIREFKIAGVEPAITSLRKQADTLIDLELRRVSGRLGQVNPEQLEEVRRMAERIVNKLLHAPIRTLKDEAVREDGDAKLLDFGAKMLDLSSVVRPDEQSKPRTPSVSSHEERRGDSE